MVPRQTGPGVQLASHHARPGRHRRLPHAQGRRVGPGVDVQRDQLFTHGRHSGPVTEPSLATIESAVVIKSVY